MTVTAREAYSIWKRDFRRGRLLGDYSEFNATFRDMAYRSGLIPLPHGWKLPLWSMLGGPLGGGGGMGYVLGQGRGGAAAQWWLSGGVSASNAIAVYQPKGAASLAASYTNLANPGTYTAAPGTAPTFDTATGWTFNGSTQYLSTGIIPPTSAWTYLCRFSNATGGQLFGFYSGAATTTVFPNTGGFRYYYNRAELKKASGVTSGVIGVAGSTAYLDGADDGAIAIPWTGNTTNIVLLGFGNVTRYNGKIQALAIYDTTLSAAQVAAISAAMAAL